MKRLVFLIGIVLILGCLGQGGGILPKEEISEVYEGSTTGEISLDFTTYNGHIEIHVWDSEAYKIEVNKWARATTSREARRKVEALQVDFSESETGEGMKLTLDVEHETNTGADITAYLPRNPFGEVDITTTNGYIRAEEITAQDASLETTNGLIEAFITAEDIRIDTTNGRIDGFYQGNNVRISTTNGAISVECGDGGRYSLETTNGKITVQMGSRGNFDVSTTNGAISITVKGDFSFDLETTNGTVTVDAPGVTYTQEDRTHKKGQTSEEYEVDIEASTTNSSITVEKE